MRAWEEFLAEQEKELGSATVKKWLTPLRIIRFDACNLYLEAKDSFHVHWFEEHIRPKILTKFVTKSNKRIKVHLSVASDSTPAKARKQTTPLQIAPFSLRFDTLDGAKPLSEFIYTDENRITLSLLFELCGFELQTMTFGEPKMALGTLNPIYLWGPDGCGKTHLLLALAQSFTQRGLRALYVRAETFTEHVVSAIREGEMQLFREAYRRVDLLLIDDIEILAKKSATQEELFHTFNTLHLEGKQIILSSGLSPGELVEIEPRLVSRFEWGIVLPLKPIKDEKIQELLHRKLQAMHLSLSQEAIDALLITFKSGIKPLLKAVDALALRLHLLSSSGKKPALPLAPSDLLQIISDLVRQEEEALLTPSKIVKVVAEYHGIRVDDILGKAQSRECSVPRKIAMYLCRHTLQLPFMRIGELFARDHSTVMTSIKQIEEQKEKVKELALALHSITKQLK